MSNLFLPRLKERCDVKPGQPGQWVAHGRREFENVAKGLDYAAPGVTRGISSVPTMWARPLLVEMILHDKSNSLHGDMVKQWRGMLAAIALANYLPSSPLTIRLLELSNLQGRQPFADALLDLIPPARDNNLYDLPEAVSPTPNLHTNPWQQLYLFFWNNQPVGMSSPSTLVVPAGEAEWSGLPWWDDSRSCLGSPERFLEAEEQQLLWLWLGQLSTNLSGDPRFGDAVNRVRGLITEFQNSLRSGAGIDINARLHQNNYYGFQLKPESLRLLGCPLKADTERPSSLSLMVADLATPSITPLVILDSQVCEQWGVKAHALHVWQGETLASFLQADGTIDRPRLSAKQLEWGRDVTCVTLDDLFTSSLSFLEGAPADLFPNGLFPDGARLLRNGREITPILPLNSLLLNYLGSQSLKQGLQFSILNTNQGPSLKVSLTLRLTGTDGQGRDCTFSRIYLLAQENCLTEIPVLEIWPNFRVQYSKPNQGGLANWRHYYLFYCDNGGGTNTFQVSLNSGLERQGDVVHSYADNGQQFQVSRFSEFPPYIECQKNSHTGESLGLILLNVPERVTLGGSWTVGVDFGTSSSNVYINQDGNENDDAKRLVLESVNYAITKPITDDRKRALIEYFIDDALTPVAALPSLPLSSVLTNRKARNLDPGLHQVIFDGRIYIPDNSTFNPRLDYIQTGLKLNSREAEHLPRLFLEHLALQVTAMAAKAGVESINWYASYPSALSDGEKRRYEQRWEQITEQLEQIGLNHRFQGLKTESLAVGQYFQDFENPAYNLVRTTCIDIGGGTADISVWNEREPVHQCSVQLAGRNLFTGILQVKPAFVARLTGNPGNQEQWQMRRESAFNAKLDLWTRWHSQEWLKRKRPGAEFDDSGDFRGFITIMAIGVAGLFYYVGQILKALHQEGSYPRKEITPVYLAGNGSQLLHWLDSLGRFEAESEFNRVLSRMLSCGSGFPDSEVTTRLSRNPKDEAACGLVIQDTNLKRLNKSEDYLVAGEAYTFGSTARPASGRVQFDPEQDDIQGFAMNDLEQLPKFLADFHQALRDFRIEAIDALPGYKIQTEREANPRLWQNVDRQLEELVLDLKQNRQQQRRNGQDVRVEPPFILALRALLAALSSDWADRFPE